MEAESKTTSARRALAKTFGRASTLAYKTQVRLSSEGGLDLRGDRSVEWSYCLGKLSCTPGDVLDFGAGTGMLSLGAAMRGHRVTALDRVAYERDVTHELITDHQADVLDRPFGDLARFDQIINCSTVEHVGLEGRYGSHEAGDGDLEAMAVLRSALRPGGTMILTVPVGTDLICAPDHRIYGEQRLPLLLDGYSTSDAEYWVKTPAAGWVKSGRADALSITGSHTFYSLGCFVLTAA